MSACSCHAAGLTCAEVESQVDDLRSDLEIAESRKSEAFQRLRAERDEARASLAALRECQRANEATMREADATIGRLTSTGKAMACANGELLRERDEARASLAALRECRRANEATMRKADARIGELTSSLARAEKEKAFVMTDRDRYYGDHLRCNDLTAECARLREEGAARFNEGIAAAIDFLRPHLGHSLNTGTLVALGGLRMLPVTPRPSPAPSPAEIAEFAEVREYASCPVRDGAWGDSFVPSKEAARKFTEGSTAMLMVERQEWLKRRAPSPKEDAPRQVNLNEVGEPYEVAEDAPRCPECGGDGRCACGEAACEYLCSYCRGSGRSPDTTPTKEK